MNNNTITDDIYEKPIPKDYKRSLSSDFSDLCLLNINTIESKDEFLKRLLSIKCPVPVAEGFIDWENRTLDDLITLFTTLKESGYRQPDQFSSEFGYMTRGILVNFDDNTDSGSLWLEINGAWTHHRIDRVEFLIVVTLLNMTTIKFVGSIVPVNER